MLYSPGHTLDARRPPKILLLAVPFWPPLTPPLGLACLKTYLARQGIPVTTVDLNCHADLFEFSRRYICTLGEFTPASNRGNYNMAGFDVFMNHLTAHMHRTSEERFWPLLRRLVRNSFFFELTSDEARQLDGIVSEFFQLYQQRLDDVLDREQPDLLGISVYSTALAAALFAFRHFKQRSPHTITVMGGGIFADQLCPGSENLEYFAEHTPYLDKIIAGEGEVLFLKYLRGELPENEKVYTLSSVPDSGADISQLDTPDFSDFLVSAYPHLTTYSTRSCPFQCRFCSETVQWGTYRKRPASRIVDDMISLRDRFGHRLFVLGDSLLNLVIDDLAAELTRREESLLWDAYLRADKPVGKVANTTRWRQSGLYRARLGIESGSQRVLDAMRKQITVQQTRDALRSLAAAGVKTTTYWIVGYPEETEEDFQETLRLLEELSDDIYEAGPHAFAFYPQGQGGSEAWTQAYGYQPLYPPEDRDMLLTQTWILSGGTRREEAFQRVRRFVEVCERHQIANPYTLLDIHRADERWRRLHPNAPPSLLSLMGAGGRAVHR